MDESRSRMEEFYRGGEVPWDAPLPPPEVMEAVRMLPAGRALDLGCGYGRASIYLAQRGWQVDGVDFVSAAVAEARRRAAEAGVAVAFHEMPVTALHKLDGLYQLALDVGCGHNLAAATWRRYHASLLRLMAPGGLFLLFARLGMPPAEDDGPKGLDTAFVRRLFARGFTLQREERGETEMAEGSWSSGWFWFRRD